MKKMLVLKPILVGHRQDFCEGLANDLSVLDHDEQNEKEDSIEALTPVGEQFSP